jgi:DNA-damage-inducible protein D
MEQDNKIVVFQEKQIRKIWHNEQWFFSVIDVIEVLTDSPKPKRYWTDIKRRSEKESGQGYAFCVPLKMTASDGRQRLTDCAHVEGILRIIMSVPSPKAEPLKLWLAQVGKERLEEIENPELGIERIRELYKAKGYSNEWIDTRLKSIDIRKQLTEEWKGRGVKEGQEYSILTAEIAKATFGLTPAEHKNLKGLETQNLRDHMTNLELIFTMLGEESTRLFAVQDDAKGFNENHESALKGGKAAGDARNNFEKSGQKVVSSDNFLQQIEASQKKTALPKDTPPETDAPE